MLPNVYAVLAAAGPVTSIVGTTPARIYRHGHAPQDVARPYVTWQLIAGEPANTLSETPAVDRCTLQVDCWHPTDAGVVDLSTAVRNAIEPHAHLTATLIDEQEPETRLYRLALQFDWWHPR